MSKIYLNEGINPRDLEKGVELQIDHEEGSSSDDSFDDERFDDFKKEIDNIQRSVDKNVSFDVLKTQMQPITDDGLILKKLIKWGTGKIIPEKSVVVMHYDAFFDNADQAYDSTRLRNKPYKFLFGDGNLIPGLELAVKTMKKDEISEFIVDSSYAYGPMGCPPRIPGNADILFRVEIINFYESKDVIEFEEMAPEEQRKVTFEKIQAVFHCELQMGNDLFNKKLYKPAIARYRKMVKILEDVSVNNQDDDDKRKHYLLKLYLNLAQSYNNLNNYQKGIIYADLALKLDPENPKGLYRMGHALYMTDEYQRAEYFLNKAKQHKPYENRINTAMKELEKRRRRHLEWEKVFCKKMFSSANQDKKKTEMPETKEFQNIVEAEIKKFLCSDKKELTFSAGYTESQKEVVKEFARIHDLAFVTKIQDGNNVIKLAKKCVPSNEN